MRIRKIQIKNFRNLKDVCLYAAKTTVIVGENNAGKSNFIHALRLLLDPQADRLRLDLSEADINDLARKSGELFFSITVELGDLQKHIEVEAVFRERLEQAKDSTETFITIEGTYRKDDEGFFEFSVYLLPPTGRKNDPIKFTYRMHKALPLFYLEALRDAERDTRATGRGVLAQMLEDVDFSDVQDDVQKALGQANRALSSGQEVASLTDGISKRLTQLTPGGQSLVKLSVSDENPLNIRKNFRLGFQKSPSHNLTDLSRHGTGLQNLALIALFRHRISSSETGTPILAIEEPEAHLHPHAQRRLFRDFTETAAPVIVTTHSTALVKYADPLGLALLRSCEDISSLYQLDREHVDEADIKSLELLMRGGRAELFFARSIIIVEGQSELIALPAFAELLGCDLDRDGISLVEAGGNNFSFILKSCNPKNFSIPSVVTYDTDVLVTSNILLKEAYKAGLIDIKERDVAEQMPEEQRPGNRKAILDKLGWFGADECFEEAVCHSGYLQTVLDVIHNNDPENHSDQLAFQTFLSRNNLSNTPKNVAKFVKKRETLKIPIAQAIFKASQSVGCVPEPYEKAIRKAVLLSQQGIIVDEYFEARSWAAGFKNLLIDFLKEIDLYGSFLDFCYETNDKLPDPIQYSEFIKRVGINKNREELKIRIAKAVLDCGCPEYGESILRETFPMEA